MFQNARYKQNRFVRPKTPCSRAAGGARRIDHGPDRSGHHEKTWVGGGGGGARVRAGIAQFAVIDLYGSFSGKHVRLITGGWVERGLGRTRRACGRGRRAKRHVGPRRPDGRGAKARAAPNTNSTAVAAASGRVGATTYRPAARVRNIRV